METQQSKTEDRELRLSRKIDAPVELLWEVWTQPEHIAQWWGPNGFTTTITKMDMQESGEWNLVMHGPDGTDYDNKSIFREVVPMKKIVYQHFAPNILGTVEFEAQGEQTLISWYMLFESRELFLEVVKQHKADEGQKQNMEKLAAYLAALKVKNLS